jgi:peptidoglycan/xylan/chitin deacetylase (PgdA/CDA1 family)
MARIALTFDAEHPDHPAASDGCIRVLDALAAAGARATFFVQGRWARARPEQARRIADDGHLVALHCHSHVPYSRLSAEGVVADVEQGRRAVREVTGVDPVPWFRFPYGNGFDRPDLVGLVRSLGFTNVHWSIDSKDWCPCAEPDGLVAAFAAALDEAGAEEGVALYHTWPPATADAIGPVVDVARSRGIDLVTLDRIEPAAIAAVSGGPFHRARCDH